MHESRLLPSAASPPSTSRHGHAHSQYSYVFDGGSGSLDHVFASASMLPKITGHATWDINATESFAYQYDGYDPLYAPDQYRAGEHNPTLIGVDTQAGTPAAGSRR